MRVGRACQFSHALGIRKRGSKLAVVTMRAASLWSIATQKGWTTVGPFRWKHVPHSARASINGRACEDKATARTIF